MKVRIEYFPDDDTMERCLEVGLNFDKLRFKIHAFASDAKKTRKFIKALKKGLRRLEE